MHFVYIYNEHVNLLGHFVYISCKHVNLFAFFFTSSYKFLRFLCDVILNRTLFIQSTYIILITRTQNVMNAYTFFIFTLLSVTIYRRNAPVAQRIRALGFEPRGRRFESCRVYHLSRIIKNPILK